MFAENSKNPLTQIPISFDHLPSRKFMMKNLGIASLTLEGYKDGKVAIMNCIIHQESSKGLE